MSWLFDLWVVRALCGGSWVKLKGEGWVPCDTFYVGNELYFRTDYNPPGKTSFHRTHMNVEAYEVDSRWA